MRLPRADRLPKRGPNSRRARANRYRTILIQDFSNAWRIASASSRAMRGFISSALIPAACACCGLTWSLKPVQMITGMSGRSSIIRPAIFRPVICGMVMSVSTRSKACGAA